MIPFGLSWIDSPRRHISFRCILLTLPRSMLRSISIALFACMGYPRQSFSIVVASFWEQLQACLGTKLIRSSAYHPQTDGQTEKVNQILEDMLRACVIHYDKSWDKCLALAEFSYNNSYQESLKMAPFEALYGRRCRTPLSWSQVGERVVFGPDLVV